MRNWKVSPQSESERSAETANQATEKDFNLLNFYSSFTGFEDEGED